MFAHLRPAFAMSVMLIAITGLAYPLAITGVAQGLFPASPTAASSSSMARLSDQS